MSVEGPATYPSSINPYDQIVAQTRRRHRLLSAHWELTYRCNEKCTHCYLDVFAPHADVPDELTTQECFRIVDELSELGVLNLTLSGGEILVRRDFFDIAEYARSKRLLLRLYTNGILIKPEIADRIAALHPYAVEISLYSANAETHDRITQLKHSWELTTRAFRLLRERGIRTVMKTPLMRETVREIHDLKGLARELGAQLRPDVTITPKDNGGLSPLKHRMSFEDLVWFFQDEFSSQGWMERRMTDEMTTCGIAQNAVAIDPYGQVTSCLQVRTPAGNLRQQSLKEIWAHSPVWGELRHLTLGELPVCRSCELRTLCNRCHGLAQFETGDLRAPALSTCRETLARREALIGLGKLPADYPVPAHLQEYARLPDALIDKPAAPTNFIPLSAIRPLHAELTV
jgi:AdoMet-dependent heme synthase